MLPNFRIGSSSLELTKLLRECHWGTNTGILLKLTNALLLSSLGCSHEETLRLLLSQKANQPLFVTGPTFGCYLDLTTSDRKMVLLLEFPNFFESLLFVLQFLFQEKVLHGYKESNHQ